jgi:hypothetical protein
LDLIPRFTRRCEQNDLHALPSGIADGLLRKVQNRIDTHSLERGDRYLSVPVPKMHTEHQGDFRAITWYDESQEVVWICAAGYHYPEKGDSRDLYEAHALHEAENLLPIGDDYARLAVERIRIEIARAQDLSRQLRRDADAKGSASGFLHDSFVEVTRLDKNLYEMRLLQRIGLEQSLALVSTVFPDHQELEWAVPERDEKGRLWQSIFVVTGD